MLDTTFIKQMFLQAVALKQIHTSCLSRLYLKCKKKKRDVLEGLFLMCVCMSSDAGKLDIYIDSSYVRKSTRPFFILGTVLRHPFMLLSAITLTGRADENKKRHMWSALDE